MGQINLRLIWPMGGSEGKGSACCEVWEVQWMDPHLVEPRMELREAVARCLDLQEGRLGVWWTEPFEDPTPRLVVSDYETGREIFALRQERGA